MTLGLSSSLLALGNVAAQQVSNPTTSQAPETAEADRVTITGSNIPTSEEVGFSPVDTIDQATRDRTGQEDVLSVLTRSNPAISSGGGNLGSSNADISSGSTLGGSQVSIHGLPTLVLLDGRRLTDASAAAAGGSSFTDVNLFPSALVKRIEVLKDGASAIYGTEAVGGVVNVILDQEFQGVDFSTRYGFTEKSDVKDQRFSGIIGFGDDKTHIVIGAEYVNQDPLFDRDRDYSKVAFGTTNYGGVARFDNSLFTLLPGVNSPNDVVAPGSIPLPTGPGNAIPAAYQANPRASLGFNLSNATDLTLDQNRFNVFASGDRQLIGDKVVAFVDFLYASNYSQNYLNAQPLNESEGVVIPAGAPYNPFNGTLSAANIGSATANNRFVDALRVFRNDADFYRIVAGLKGNIIKDVTYEVALNSSRDETTTKNPGLVIASDLNDAIAGGYNAAGVAVPATFDAAGNVLTPAGNYSMVRGVLQPAVDFFAANPNPGSIANFTGDNIRYILTKFQGVDGKITAFPYTLPAGPIGFAAGGEYRHETLKLNDSPEVFVGSVPVGDIDVGRDEFALFSEVQIPLISPDMKIPGLYKADIDGAGRYESYSTTGSVWVPKVGFTLLPIKDVALRGSFSKSFIAPTLYQTEGPSSSGFSNSVTLTGAGGLPGSVSSEQSQVISGSNPNLSASRADTYTAGLVLSPHQVPGLTANLDFFHVVESRLIGTIDPTTALANVNSLGAASVFAPFVHFGSINGPTVTAPGVLANNLPQYFVSTTEQNLGRQEIGGLDFGIHYTHDFGAFGAATVGIDGTYYLQYKLETLKGLPSYDIIGIYNGLAGETEQYHLTPQVGYQYEGFSISAIGNYIPSLRDANSIGGVQVYDPSPIIGGYNLDKNHELPKIRDYFTVDLLASYEFGLNRPSPGAPPAPKDGKDRVVSGKDGKDSKTVATSQEMAKSMFTTRLLDGLKISFGITNLSNARPSQIENSPDASNTDGSIYDLAQRSYYVVLSKKF